MTKNTTSITLMMLLLAAGMIFVACTQAGIINSQPCQGGVDCVNKTGKIIGDTGSGSLSGPEDTLTVDKTFFEDKELKIKSFSSEAEYKAFMAKYASGSSYGLYGGGIRMIDMAETTMLKSADARAMAPTAAGGSGSANEYSGTNNQVAGVDEADLLKTDGDYIYTITDTTLYIIKAYPGKDAEVTARITFKSAPSALFVQGDRLAVFGNFYDVDYFKEVNIRPRQGMAFLNIYDISDKENPRLVQDYKFEGNYFNGRMKDSWVYLITTAAPDYRGPFPTPLILKGNTVSAMPVRDIAYYPIPYRNPELVTVHAVDLAHPDDITSKAITVEGGENVYMSADNIYITSTEWVNEWEIRQDLMKGQIEDKLSQADQDYIKKIEAVDDEVLSPAEKQSKINQVYWEYVNYLPQKEQQDFNDRLDKLVKDKMKTYKYFEYTVVSKISVDQGKIEASGTGKVPGRIINQFSLDEDKGVLRIATTISQRWSPREDEMQQSVNGVYTLDADMEIEGSLDGLAKGEQIYSTRFMGDRLYMVTYRQVDPFFVIDLSDPRDPQMLGKLKIPGFSRYLHPYDENTIIGIGQDATETGRTEGLKISLFDVTDVENPKEIAKYVTAEEHAQSTALYEHKAFLFSKEKDLLVIPVYSYDWRPVIYEGGKGTTAGGYSGYNGAFVFRVTKDDIELRGLIDHAKGAQGNYWSALVERSLFINDLLYTKSPHLLRINDLDTLKGVKDVGLEPTQTGEIPVY